MLPTFMPVATQAAIKGLTPQQVEALGITLILNNTYHLGLKPGQEVLDAIGGAHKLQGWNHNILTDSGGFQMVSLLQLANITEEGVRFLSPHDGTPMLLTIVLHGTSALPGQGLTRRRETNQCPAPWTGADIEDTPRHHGGRHMKPSVEQVGDDPVLDL